MTHAISDERAREAIKNLRERGWGDDGQRKGISDVNHLMMYVAERLPRETKPARWVGYVVLDGEPGTRMRNEQVFEDELPTAIARIVANGVSDIHIGNRFEKDVR